MQNLKSLIKNNAIVVFDLETSGLDKNRDYVIEIGAVKLENGKISNKFSTLVNSPQMVALPPAAERLTGITFEQLKTALPVDRVLQSFYQFAEGSILAAHNLPFGFAFLRNWGFWCGVCFDGFQKDALDIAALAKQVLGDRLKDCKLATVANYFNIEFTGYRAFEDAEAAAEILLQLAAVAL